MNYIRQIGFPTKDTQAQGCGDLPPSCVKETKMIQISLRTRNCQNNRPNKILVNDKTPDWLHCGRLREAKPRM